MDDALIAMFVMRGVVRLAVALISGMCLFLAWKLTSRMLQHPGRDDLLNDWTTNWRRSFVYVVRFVPAVILACIAGWLLFSLMQPMKARISEVPCPTKDGSTPSLANHACNGQEYAYEDSGL
jgi:hypothetical protein